MERTRAVHALVVEAIELGPGPWVPHLRVHDDAAPHVLLLAGLLCREIRIAGRESAELLGQGDVIRPAEGPDALLPHEVGWTVRDAAVIAVLDGRFALAAQYWPSLSARLQERLLARSERLAMQLAVAHLPRVEQRVLGLLWLLAERWGKVVPEGVVLPLALTHELLGRLVGARRPTVSLAVTELVDAGHLVRRPHEWLLPPASRAAIDTGEVPGALLRR